MPPFLSWQVIISTEAFINSDYRQSHHIHYPIMDQTQHLNKTAEVQPPRPEKTRRCDGFKVGWVSEFQTQISQEGIFT